MDLNRNFPFRWRPLGPPGGLFYVGPRPLSEPESGLAARLIVGIRPVLAIWYHQALDVVDDSQGPRAAERRYASLTGVREAPLIDYPGSVVGWEDATIGLLLSSSSSRQAPSPRPVSVATSPPLTSCWTDGRRRHHGCSAYLPARLSALRVSRGRARVPASAGSASG